MDDCVYDVIPRIEECINKGVKEKDGILDALKAEGMISPPECLFADIIYLYQSVRFGSVPASEEQVQKTELYTQMLEKQYLFGCGRMKRLLYRLK